MADPFSLVTGVLSVARLVLQVASGATGMVGKTVTAHATQKRAVRDLQRELEKIINGTENMQTVLKTMLGNPKDKIVKRICRKCVLSKVTPLMPEELTSTAQYGMCNRTKAASEGTRGYPRMD